MIHACPRVTRGVALNFADAGSAATGLANPNIDGFFIDDGWGSRPSEEDPDSVRDMGLDPVEVAKIRAGWAANMAAVKAEILKAGGFNWQMIDLNSGTAAAAPFNRAGCTQYVSHSKLSSELTPI